LPPQQINAWIKPLEPLDFDEESGVLLMSAPNRFKLDWVRKNFAARIQELASNWFKSQVVLELELAHSPVQSQPVVTAATLFQQQDQPGPQVGQENAANGQCTAAMPAGGAPAYGSAHAASAAQTETQLAETLYEQSRLNPELTFENFVTGRANQLARAAAL